MFDEKDYPQRQLWMHQAVKCILLACEYGNRSAGRIEMTFWCVIGKAMPQEGVAESSFCLFDYQSLAVRKFMI